MKHLPKSTLTEILNDPYGFTYKLKLPTPKSVMNLENSIM